MVSMDYNVEYVLTKPSNSLFVGYMTKATNSVSLIMKLLHHQFK